MIEGAPLPGGGEWDENDDGRSALRRALNVTCGVDGSHAFLHGREAQSDRCVGSKTFTVVLNAQAELARWETAVASFVGVLFAELYGDVFCFAVAHGVGQRLLYATKDGQVRGLPVAARDVAWLEDELHIGMASHESRQQALDELLEGDAPELYRPQPAQEIAVDGL